MSNYDGLTRNTWPGTWSSNSSHPIVLDTELRGSLQNITGNVGNRLTDISGQRLQEGMLVYVKLGYTSGNVTILSESYYQYKCLPGETRDINTGRLPNSDANWTLFSAGPTGQQSPGFLNGNGVPQSIVGKKGDFYIDMISGDVYGPKGENDWV